jgi:GntP family gluconate:H+ symporter
MTTVVLAAGGWTGHDTRLITVTLLGIGVVVALIVALKAHPFLALILGSAFVGFAAGVVPAKIISNFEAGVGSTLQEVGLLIALGAMLGKLLADSGGADQVIDRLLRRARKAAVPWAMAVVALIIGLPMFFEIGLVLLLPVIVLVARRAQLPLMRVAIPALAGLSVLHGLVPPHPGPLLAISALHAQLGLTLALGLLVAVPTVIVCGPLLSILVTRMVPVPAPDRAGGLDTTAPTTRSEDVKRPPSFGVTLATILFPVVLMLAKGLADIIWSGDHPPVARAVLDFIGEPLVALTLAVLLAMVTFGYAVGLTGTRIAGRITASVGPVAAVILIVGAGGGFSRR